MTSFTRGASVAALTAVLALGSFAARADVLTFDDLTGTQFFDATYHGFSFGNLDPATNDWFATDVVQAPYTAHSGLTSLATDASLYNGLPLEDASGITSSTAFVFEGAWFAGYTLNGDGTPAEVQYKLYNGGALVFSSAPSAQLSSVSTFYASGYAGLVDKVVVSGPQGYYALDDFTYSVSSVPEASSFAMIVAGMAALAAVASRRRGGASRNQ